jgi:hypothetical protein
MHTNIQLKLHKDITTITGTLNAHQYTIKVTLRYNNNNRYYTFTPIFN